MQVSIDIRGDLYQKVINNGVDMQTKFNEYISTLFDLKESYVNSKQFQEDITFFENSFQEIENGKVQLVPFDNGLDKLDDFIDNVELMNIIKSSKFNTQLEEILYYL
jgi:hypothetical protein